MKLDPHHRKLRKQGGDDSWGNQIRLPRDIHDLIHMHPAVAYEHGMLVREGDNPHLIEPDLAGFCAAVGYDREPALIKEKPKRKNFEKGSEERRNRKKIGIAVPNDTENGGEIWDDTVDRVKQRLIELGLYEEGAKIPVYECVVAALQDWLDNWTYS